MLRSSSLYQSKYHNDHKECIKYMFPQHCDSRIQENYSGQKSIISAALMTGEEVELNVTENAEWDVTYDREPAKVHV